MVDLAKKNYMGIWHGSGLEFPPQNQKKRGRFSAKNHRSPPTHLPRGFVGGEALSKNMVS